jgi:hypothetical protein
MRTGNDGQITAKLCWLVLTLVFITVGARGASAAPVALPQDVAIGPGSTSWGITNTGGTSTGGPFTGDCDDSPGFTITDARAADGHGDAYDNAWSPFVNGTIFSPGGTVDLTGNVLTAGPVNMSGLNVTYQLRFSSTAQLARLKVYFANPTAADIAATVQVPINFGSDAGTVVRATSSGDTTVTTADRWVVTSDAGPSDPVNTTVMYGPGAPAVIPSSGTQTVFDCSATNGIGATFNITVPALSGRSLMFFAGLGDIAGTGNTIAGAISNAANFNSNATLTTLDPTLLADLTSEQRLEILNWDFAGSPRLTNISTRGRVETGADVLIGGFVIGGSTSVMVLVRALGPTLGLPPFNVPGALPNPTVTLFSGSTPIASNDDWQTVDPLCASSGHTCGGPADITATGLAPPQPLEAALLITLPPGAYTAIVSGVGGTGVGLVEVYEVP